MINPAVSLHTSGNGQNDIKEHFSVSILNVVLVEEG